MTDAPIQIATTIHMIIRHMVMHPENVFLTMVPDDGGGTLRVSVAPDDLGIVIGKQGRNAKSLRVLLSAMSSKRGVRMGLDISLPKPEAG